MEKLGTKTQCSHLESVSQNFSAFPAASAPRSTAPSKKERRVGFLILRESTLLQVFFFPEEREGLRLRRKTAAHLAEEGSDGRARRRWEKKDSFSRPSCSNSARLYARIEGSSCYLLLWHASVLPNKGVEAPVPNEDDAKKPMLPPTRFFFQLFVFLSRFFSLSHSRDDAALPERAQGHAREHQLHGRGGEPRHLGG